MARSTRAAELCMTEADFEALEDFYAAEARDSFYAFRRYMDPTLKVGWFVYDMAMHLQQFYEDMVAGKAPMLIIEAPPQHGKSRGLSDFHAWVAGKDPDIAQMYGSYSNNLGVRANRYLQRMFDDRTKYGRVFPDTSINTSNVVTSTAGRWLRNSEQLEFVGRKGGFNNITINGQVTGKGLGFGVIDDPLKGRKEASSKQIRNTTWEFLLDDFYSRFTEEAGLILTMTRWHVDDPAGRWKQKFPETKVISYPALWRKPKNADEAAKRSPGDPRRIPDEPLFPEHKSKAFLLRRRKSYTSSSWESLYQGQPIITGGGLFPINRVRVIDSEPLSTTIKKTIRYWDKAGTSGGGKATAGVLMHHLNDGRWCVSDVRRGQWGAWEREENMKLIADMDAKRWDHVEIWIEREPGSGGKESAERSIVNLAGHVVFEDRVTGSKVLRAEPYAAQWQGGNILLVRGNWNSKFIDEHEAFPNGHFIDQVDAAAGAFAKTLGANYRYDSSLEWVG